MQVGKVSMETTLTIKEFIKSVEFNGYFILFFIFWEKQPNSALCRLTVELPKPHTNTRISSRTPLNK